MTVMRRGLMAAVLILAGGTAGASVSGCFFFVDRAADGFGGGGAWTTPS